jgi:3-keto-5-aminohexanoate cleavage enzyme
MFSDEFAWGFPPKTYALEAHLALLDAVAAGSPWIVAGLGVDIEPLVADAVARGGHVRVGLEDARFGCPHRNVRLVEAVIRKVEAAGGEPASAAETRRALDHVQKR